MKATKKRRIIFFGSIFFAIAVAAVITVLGVLYLFKMEASLWNQLVQDVSEVASQGAHAFETYVYKESVSVDRLANNLSLRSPTTETEDICNILDLYANDGIYTLVIYNADGSGTLYVAGSEDFTALSAAEMKKRYSGYSDRGISEPYLNDYNGHLTIGYYERINFADGGKGIVRKGQLVSYLRDEFSLSYYNNAGFRT